MFVFFTQVFLRDFIYYSVKRELERATIAGEPKFYCSPGVQFAIVHNSAVVQATTGNWYRSTKYQTHEKVFLASTE